MRQRIVRTAAAVLLVLVVLLISVIHAAALDDTYSFSQIGMSIKFPKEFNVITINTARGDEVFEKVNLDYDETMIAFKAADIYLRAYDPDLTYQISMTVTQNENTQALNNYADLTTAERKVMLDSLLEDESVQSAVEVKRGDNIFIDSQLESTAGDKPVYINQCNTVINGYQIDLSLQKSDEAITPEEARILTNAAGTLKFDHVKRNTGAVFSWWRLLLWVGILAALAIAISVIYKQYHAANKRKLEERLARREGGAGAEPQPAHAQQETITFEEQLGYKDDEEFAERADADEMAAYDINVRERDPNKGIEFFEDEGSNIDDGTDYFDTYFKEPVEQRSPVQRFFTAVGSAISRAFKHTGYFFKNLFAKIFKR